MHETKTANSSNEYVLIFVVPFFPKFCIILACRPVTTNYVSVYHYILDYNISVFLYSRHRTQQKRQTVSVRPPYR